MAKHSVPKKQTSNSQASRRYKAFQNSARKKLMSMADSVKKLHKVGKFKSAARKPTDKVTKIKA